MYFGVIEHLWYLISVCFLWSIGEYMNVGAANGVSRQHYSFALYDCSNHSTCFLASVVGVYEMSGLCQLTVALFISQPSHLMSVGICNIISCG